MVDVPWSDVVVGRDGDGDMAEDARELRNVLLAVGGGEACLVG